MVQQMIDNDPNIPPHVRQSIQSLGSNPAMMNQLSQMMSDPMVRRQMQSALGSGGGGGGMPNMGAGMPNMPNMMGNMGNQAPPSNNNNNNSSGDDPSQTEDEMIAEAIRRSLEE
jgi:hypothetical protein